MSGAITAEHEKWCDYPHEWQHVPNVTVFVEKRLKLRVNKEKTSVQPATKATLLGFGFFMVKGGKVKVRVAPNAIYRLKERLRALTRFWAVCWGRATSIV